MRYTGSRRPLDDSGRLSLPKDLRIALGWNTGDGIDIYINDDGVFLRKELLQKCKFCGTSDRLVSFKNTPVCKECIKAMNELGG